MEKLGLVYQTNGAGKGFTGNRAEPRSNPDSNNAQLSGSPDFNVAVSYLYMH